MQIIHDVKLDFNDVLIKPKRSQAASRSQVDLTRKYNYLHAGFFGHWSGVPVIAANMSATGTMQMAKVFADNEMMCCLHKHYSVKDLIAFFRLELTNLKNNTFYTLGIKDADFDKLAEVAKGAELKNICVDVANGYTEYFQNKVKEVRERFPDACIMAGNVATPEMVQELLISGACDIVKVGIGPGSVCTTRLMTGCGYPQLSAIIECADAAHGLGGHICADGGCVYPADVVKAFGAGADFVMLGGMLAGTTECEGEWETDEGCPAPARLKFFGMSSQEAMNKYSGGVASYKAAEGKCVTVNYKGPVTNVIKDVLGGLRSACAYVGAPKLKDLSKCCTFVRCTATHNTIYEGR
tara:strand:+ start:1077 stop:2135 length:1059 start_codon:yes stop_codon:yes gene_type:complete